MYNEHCLGSGAKSFFKAWNAGHVIDTTPEREVSSLVGSFLQCKVKV